MKIIVECTPEQMVNMLRQYEDITVTTIPETPQENLNRWRSETIKRTARKPRKKSRSKWGEKLTRDLVKVVDSAGKPINSEQATRLLRKSSKEYRTIPFGTVSGRLWRIRNSKWVAVEKRGTVFYHSPLENKVVTIRGAKKHG